MKRKCIHRVLVSGFLAVAMLAVVVQPSFAAPKPQHRVSVVASGSWLEVAVVWVGNVLAEKVYNRTDVYPILPPPPPPPSNGGLGGPFCGSSLDPAGSPNCGM